MLVDKLRRVLRAAQNVLDSSFHYDADVDQVLAAVNEEEEDPLACPADSYRELEEALAALDPLDQSKVYEILENRHRWHQTRAEATA